jgi:hypothetical protein
MGKLLVLRLGLRMSSVGRRRSYSCHLRASEAEELEDGVRIA